VARAAVKDPLSLAVGKKGESIDLDLISMDSTHFSSETPSVDYSTEVATALFLGWTFEKKKGPVYVQRSPGVRKCFIFDLDLV
jgi:hypothetical protein